MVDWGDGTIESKSASTTLLSHTYTTAGDKEVKVQNITRFYANNIDFHGKLIFVNDWGNIQWLDMKDMFFGADHLISLPNSVPNMSKVKDMSFMFVNAKVFNQDISSWDVSNVINMNSMFNNTLSFNN
ncbi:MAG: DUF285 domain-containing protein [Candidatus Peribacteria bacterium]|nr:DUF285 domain-containing protein [Candidatus Peribacteria bacterium]